MKKTALLLGLIALTGIFAGCSGEETIKPEDSMEAQLKEAAKAGGGQEPEGKKGMKNLDKTEKGGSQDGGPQQAGQ